MKKTIAIDLDDVLSATVPAFIKYSNDRWGTNLTVDDCDERWAKMFGVDEKTAEDRAVDFHDSGFVANYERIHQAENVLNLLKYKFNLAIVTSRRRMIEKETTEWIAQHFPGMFSEIHFAGMWDRIHKDSHKITKADICKEIGADFLIDDQIKHCEAAAGAGVPSLLFGEYPWNKRSVLPENVTRVKDWRAVAEYFGVG